MEKTAGKWVCMCISRLIEAVSSSPLSVPMWIEHFWWVLQKTDPSLSRLLLTLRFNRVLYTSHTWQRLDLLGGAVVYGSWVACPSGNAGSGWPSTPSAAPAMTCIPALTLVPLRPELHEFSTSLFYENKENVACSHSHAPFYFIPWPGPPGNLAIAGFLRNWWSSDWVLGQVQVTFMEDI